MKRSYFLRGSGGQGVQVVGMMLLYAINEQGGYASFFPEYGSNKRGGFSQCAVMTSSEPIYSFTAPEFDTLVLLNQDSFDKFGTAVKAGGLRIVNSGLIHDAGELADVKTVGVPFDEIARNVGDQKVMNTLLFGFLAGYLGIVDRAAAEKIVLKTTGEKPAYREMNLAALEAGFREAEKLL